MSGISRLTPVIIFLLVLIAFICIPDTQNTSTAIAQTTGGLLLSDNFSDGGSHWFLDNGLTVDTIDGKSCLKLEGSYKYAVLEGEWSDYTFRCKLKMIDGPISFDFRKSYTDGPYGYTLQENRNSIMLLRYNGSTDGTSLDFKTLDLGDKWHTLEFNCYGGSISVKIDNKLAMSYTDTDPVREGTIEVCSHPDSLTYMTDVEIWGTQGSNSIFPPVPAGNTAGSNGGTTGASTIGPYGEINPTAAASPTAGDGAKSGDGGIPSLYLLIIGAIVVAIPIGFIGITKMKKKPEVPAGTGPAFKADTSAPVGAIAAFDVFISYSTKDKHIADAICHMLENNKVRCWIAPRDIPVGTNYAGSIIKAIKSSKVMVIVYSSNSNASPHVLREVEQAVNNGIPIITFRLEDTPPTPELQYYIGPVHWLDALTPPLEDHMQKLSSTVQLLISQDNATKKQR